MDLIDFINVDKSLSLVMAMILLWGVYQYLKYSPDREAKQEMLMREMITALADSTGAAREMLSMIDVTKTAHVDMDQKIIKIESGLEDLSERVAILQDQISSRDTTMAAQLNTIASAVSAMQSELRHQKKES